ncbi:hypothetical protein ACT7DJ_19740 [Bacillus cereus]
MMKFNSVDLQANIKEGKNYNFTLRGYRVPILSWFPNLDGAEPQKLALFFNKKSYSFFTE